jgi:hypothetical protein
MTANLDARRKATSRPNGGLIRRQMGGCIFLNRPRRHFPVSYFSLDLGSGSAGRATTRTL